MLHSFHTIHLDIASKIFTAGIPPAKIRDPFCTKHGFLGERLLEEGTHFPILLARSLECPSNGLLVFIAREDERVIVWYVAMESQVKHKSQFQCSRTEIALFLGLTEDSARLCHECIQESVSRAPDWVQTTSSNFLDLLRCKAPDKPAPRSTRALTNIAFSDYITLANTATDALLEFIEKETKGVEKELIRSYLKAYDEQLGDTFRPSFYNVARYCALRELYTYVTGEYIAIDPFTKHHARSYSSRAWRTDSGFTSRLIKYQSAAGPTFIERRGPGWLDVTSQIIFSNGLIVDIKNGQQWGSINENELVFIYDYFKHSGANEDTPRPVHLYIDLGGKNLGHLLWNEISGYIEFNLLTKRVGFIPATFTLGVPPTESNLFSQKGIRSHLQPYIKKALDRVPRRGVSLVDSELAEYETPSLKNGDSKDHFSLVSFRYPRLSPHLVQAIRDDYPDSTDQTLRIYINMRSHNKCHSNLVECIDSLLSNLMRQDVYQLGLVSLELEYFASDDEQAPKVSDLCKQRNLQCNHHIGYEIPQLFQLISHSSICIAPIGSGAIGPTWIFNKPTVVHGDRRHMSQLKWWSDAGGSRLQIFPIPTSAISDDYDKFYSNYKINPKAYSDMVLNCLASVRPFQS